MERSARFEIFKSRKDSHWYWHLKGGNGEIMAQSEAYGSGWNAKRGAKRFASLVAGASYAVIRSK